MTCENYGALTVCRPSSWKIFHTEDIGKRWCFRCRKHVEFVYEVAGETGITYYEPNPSVHCKPNRHIDGDVGFGGCREWE